MSRPSGTPIQPPEPLNVQTTHRYVLSRWHYQRQRDENILIRTVLNTLFLLRSHRRLMSIRHAERYPSSRSDMGGSAKSYGSVSYPIDLSKFTCTYIQSLIFPMEFYLFHDDLEDSEQNSSHRHLAAGGKLQQRHAWDLQIFMKNQCKPL